MPPNLGRVVVVGTSCSGKTTLARTLAQMWRIPHTELDTLHWLPHWQSRPLADFRALTRQAIAAERWTLDGNYSRVRDIVWGRATAVIWLNYPFGLVLRRALYRTTRRVFWQERLFAGNRETFRQAFLSRDSMLWWVIQTYHRRRREYPALFAQPQYSHLEIITFDHPRQTRQFLAQLHAAETGRSSPVKIDR